MGTALGAEAVEWERISLAGAVAQLQSGDMKAESLLLRLLRRAVRITAATNCVTEFPHELGTLQKVAKQLDGEVERSTAVGGKLQGAASSGTIVDCSGPYYGPDRVCHMEFVLEG